MSVNPYKAIDEAYTMPAKEELRRRAAECMVVTTKTTSSDPASAVDAGAPRKSVRKSMASSMPEDKPKLPPHVFSAAANAYGELLHGIADGSGENQSVLVSGESGAGKTFASTIMVQYLCQVSE